VSVVVDEIAFFGLDQEAKTKSDTELIRAIEPGLATTGGRLIAITSPYARKGWTFNTYQKNWGNDKGHVLVWNAPSRLMNPTLPQSVVDAAVAEDLQAAKSEFLGEFRDDVGQYLPRDVIEKVVVKNRRENMPRHGIRYAGFVDMSGGRGDDAAICIGHREGRKIIVDYLKAYKSPLDPYVVCQLMAKTLRGFGLRRVLGDRFAAEFTAQAFTTNRIGYLTCDKTKNEMYLEMLPVLCAGELELVDDETLINQLANLERRTRSGGKDIIDHPRGQKDDMANVVAGLVTALTKQPIVVGALRDRDAPQQPYDARREEMMATLRPTTGIFEKDFPGFNPFM
jgi:hypothetical protein